MLQITPIIFCCYRMVILRTTVALISCILFIPLVISSNSSSLQQCYNGCETGLQLCLQPCSNNDQCHGCLQLRKNCRTKCEQSNGRKRRKRHITQHGNKVDHFMKGWRTFLKLKRKLILQNRKNNLS